MAALAVLLLLALVRAPTAAAHALVVSSDPAAGSSLTRIPKQVTVTFSEAPAPAQSSLLVVDSSGFAVSRGPTRTVPGKPLELQVALRPLLNGVYTVRWHAVSADDGHVSGGTFTFGVGPTAYAAASAPIPSLVSAPSSAGVGVVAGHWIYYVGLGLLVGGSWILIFALPDAGSRLSILTLCGAVAMLAGLTGYGLAQGHADGIPFSGFADTSLGLGLIGQAVPGLVATVCVATAARQDGRRRRAALHVSLLSAAVAMLVHALTTHAASARHVWLEVSMQWLHLASFAAWIGGLAALLVAVGTEPSPAKAAAIRRFSQVAALSLAALLFSGLLRALADVASLRALLDSLFGRLVLVKVALVVVLAGLGARNRLVSVPMADWRLRGLRRVGSLELGVAAGALLVAAVLTSSLPPALAAKAVKQTPPPLLVEHGTAPGANAVLDVGPGYPGPDQFTVNVFDAATRKPIGDAVTLAFALASRPDLQPSTLDLKPAGSGGFSAIGDGLAAVGTWTVTATVKQGTKTVTIPFQVPCTLSPTLTEEMTMGRMVMAYGIVLPGGRRLEAYLTPGRSGLNTLHLIFTDAAGGPSGVRGVPTVTVGDGRAAHSITMLRIAYGIPNPNSFYATVTLPSGRPDFHVQAVATAGTSLVADFALTVP